MREPLTVNANQTLDSFFHPRPRRTTIRRWESTEEFGAAHPGNNPDHAPNHDPEESAR